MGNNGFFQIPIFSGYVSQNSRPATRGEQGLPGESFKDRELNKKRKAGTASAIATAGLLQSYKPGQSVFTAAAGQYQGQSSIAVGISHLSENGKYGIKLSITTNSQKEMGSSIGIGYFW